MASSTRSQRSQKADREDPADAVTSQEKDQLSGVAAEVTAADRAASGHTLTAAAAGEGSRFGWRGSEPPVTGAGCPCGRGAAYDDCCGRCHRGDAAAPTAEALMRSRFSAFAVGDVHYLRDTWHPSTRPRRLDLEPDRRWTRLEVLATSGGSLFETSGTVEFAAHYEVGGRPGVQRERSAFVRERGRWYYVGAD